ncbi:MAG: hypothetical protein Q8940_07195 [Bacteroidota bacterium]|nr:hypothetical protein [Bacteroidota bacterium]
MNQRSIIAERPSGPFLPGLYMASGTIKNTDTNPHTATFDNLPVRSILYASGEKVLSVDGTLPLVVYGAVAGGTKANTKKVTFNILAGSTFQYLIIGTQTETVNALSINTDSVITPTV